MFGDEDQYFSPQPKQFTVPNDVKDIKVGDLLTIVLTQEGDIYTLGSSMFGQLGRKKRQEPKFYKGKCFLYYCLINISQS